jgi:isoleucyl-tRNA synthetase
VEIAGVRSDEIGIDPDELAELFIVSSVAFSPGDAEVITVTRAEEHGHKKCVRCWRFYPSEELGTRTEHPELCPRCTEVVLRCEAA